MDLVSPVEAVTNRAEKEVKVRSKSRRRLGKKAIKTKIRRKKIKHKRKRNKVKSKKNTFDK